MKTRVKNQNSEESEKKNFSVMNLLSSRTRKANIRITHDSVDNIKEKSGNDRSIWRTTWGECLNLYQCACEGQTIKNDDKDEYLPDKFFGWHVFNGTLTKSSLLYSFFINRMLASIFSKSLRFLFLLEWPRD